MSRFKGLVWMALSAVVSLSPSSSQGQFWTRIIVEQKVTPELVSADQLPRYGTFWSLQRTNCPPLPFYAPFLRDLNAPVYLLDAQQNIFVVDDSAVDYVALYQQREAERVLRQVEWENGLLTDAQYWALEGGSPQMATMMSSLASSYAYGNAVYLANMAATNTGASVTASFSLAGGTNNVPYDILTSTNAASPIADWQWLGIGYTSNRYTFSGQPLAHAFYLLAKPQRTMVVGWGADDYQQSGLQLPLTNALQVAGGRAHSLALLGDGRVVGWGNDYLGQLDIPTNLIGAAMISCGYYHSLALQTNGSVAAWGYNDSFYNLLAVPADLTNATVITANGLHSLALQGNGTMVAWGYNFSGEATVPSGLSNVVAIAAGYRHNLAAKEDGTVTAWGYNDYGQRDVPTNLNNVVDVAAGVAHSLALREDGTVVAWGRNTYGETNVPAGLSNVVAIAAGGEFNTSLSFSMALKKDNTLVIWGNSQAVTPLAGMSNVIAIAAGTDHALAVRSGPRTPVLTLQPTNQFQLAGGDVMFAARGVGLYGVTYQWKTNGVNLAGATNATLTLTNVQAVQAVDYTVTASNEVGTITSPSAHLTLVTPPIITSQSPLPTNRVCIYGNVLLFSITASAPGQLNGFPLSYQWAWNGTNLSSATNSAYSLIANDNSSGVYSVTVANAAGSTNASWQVTVTNAINVTNDLLLIYNTNSENSRVVKDYYLAHRPMVGGVNVLGITCTTEERISDSDFTNQLAPQVGSWLAVNPTKRPQYIILFPNIPSRVWTASNSEFLSAECSVSYGLHTNFPGYRPFVTSINMGLCFGGVTCDNLTNDCIAYINKLEQFGSNYSPGQLFISASKGEYGNTNYVVDDVRHDNYESRTEVADATNGLLAASVSTNAIRYSTGVEYCIAPNPTNSDICDERLLLPQLHITNAVDVAGYICWGVHGSLTNIYPIDGEVRWSGRSSWWIIETAESQNGWRGIGQGNFTQWFSSTAFGGTNYSNTPVGAVSHTDEPYLSNVNNSSSYFRIWAEGKCFGAAAWASRRTEHFQAVGDPFVAR